MSMQELFITGEMPKRTLSLFEEAIIDYNTAIELNPVDGKAYNNRGIAKANLNGMKMPLKILMRRLN